MKANIKEVDYIRVWKEMDSPVIHKRKADLLVQFHKAKISIVQYHPPHLCLWLVCEIYLSVIDKSPKIAYLYEFVEVLIEKLGPGEDLVTAFLTHGICRLENDKENKFTVSKKKCINLNSIPLWEWMWCYCVSYVRQVWDACAFSVSGKSCAWVQNMWSKCLQAF